jgi:hypothetical protein
MWFGFRSVSSCTGVPTELSEESVYIRELEILVVDHELEKLVLSTQSEFCI